MGIASVIVGVLSILLSWIPCLWPIVAVHIVIGLGLGGGDVAVKLRSAKTSPLGDDQVRRARIGVGIAGICLNVIAIILTITWQMFWITKGFGAFDFE